MSFPFYLNHEYRCPHVGHCPHLGGATLGSVVNVTNQNQLERDAMFRTIDAQREQISRHLAEIQRLEYELKQGGVALFFEKSGEFVVPLLCDCTQSQAVPGGSHKALLLCEYNPGAPGQWYHKRTFVA